MIGFKKAKSQLIRALEEAGAGRRVLYHEARQDIPSKNLLRDGQVTPTEICAVVRQSRGLDYSESSHHQAPSLRVHVLKCRHQGVGWYIKWYVLAPDVWFISVHH